MRRFCILNRKGSPRLQIRKRLQLKKCTHDDDDDTDEKEEEKTKISHVDSQVSTSASRKLKASSPKSHFTPRPAPDLSRSELALSDDVLSSVTRSFESMPKEAEQEDTGPLKLLMGWSIDPDSAFAFYWKAAVTLAVIYNCSVVILRTAFVEMRSEVSFTALDQLSDIIYVLDIVFESKTSFLSDGCLVTDSKQKFEHYRRKKQFVHDIISVLPLHTFVVQIAYGCELFHLAESELHTFWKYFSSYHSVLRLNRLLKCHAMDRFFQRTESRTNKPNLLRAFKLSLHLGLVIHWIACLYYMLSEYEGLGINEWVYPLEPNVTRFSRKYILCMFWSTMTLTTIGERPPPVTEMEYLFTGFTFLVGVFVFAAVVGNVGDVISNMNAARRDFQARMDQIKFYMDHRNVPEDLQNRIKRWAEYTWDRTKAIDEPHALQFLPERLRTEVAIHVHLSILKQVSIFADCEEGLLRELVLKLKPQIFSPGDYICRIGEIGRDMYIINHGKVEILFPDFETGALIQVAVMCPGNFFGEISLLKLDDGQNKRTADVRSVGFSELLCLSRRDLIVALAEYPGAKKVLEDYARQRFNNTKKLSPLDTDDSKNVTPRASYVTMQNKRTARQIFSQVMRTEGFAKLLAITSQNNKLMEIKAAVDELKAAKNVQAEENNLCLQRKVQELEKLVLNKNLELQESRVQVKYLEEVISHHSKVTELSLLGKSNSDIEQTWQQQDQNKVPQKFQNNLSIVSDENVMDSYDHTSKMLKKANDIHKSNTRSLCSLRRTYFRTAAHQNVHSNDHLNISSLADSSASLYSESDDQEEVTGKVSIIAASMENSRPVCSLSTNRSLKCTSVPQTTNVGENFRPYIQHGSTTDRYSSSCTHIPSLSSKLSSMESRCRFMPKQQNAAAENTHAQTKKFFS